MPEHWEKVQTAVWLIGLAILAWQGWWWPGVLVLVAISGLTQALINRQVKKETEQGKQRTKAAAVEADTAARRATAEAALPDACPSCGSPVIVEDVRWSGTTSASCAYCGGALPTNPENSITEAT